MYITKTSLWEEKLQVLMIGEDNMHQEDNHFLIIFFYSVNVFLNITEIYSQNGWYVLLWAELDYFS